jgi:hypothetical protein
MFRALIDRLRPPTRFMPYDDLSLRSHIETWHRDLFFSRTMWNKTLTNWDIADSNPYIIHLKDHECRTGKGGDPRHKHA